MSGVMLFLEKELNLLNNLSRRGLNLCNSHLDPFNPGLMIKVSPPRPVTVMHLIHVDVGEGTRGNGGNAPSEAQSLDKGPLVVPLD